MAIPDSSRNSVPGTNSHPPNKAASSKTSTGSSAYKGSVPQTSNKKLPPGKPISVTPSKLSINRDERYRVLASLLEYIPPDRGESFKYIVGMGIYHETGGADDGFSLFDKWCRRDPNFQGTEKLKAEWDSLADDQEIPITIVALCNIVSNDGFDVSAIIGSYEFESLTNKSEISGSVDSDDRLKETRIAIAFDGFSLKGSSHELIAQALATVFVLYGIAVLGQWTVIYARHNAGKTLIVIFLMIESIKAGRIIATDVYYFDLDDNHTGLTEKVVIAEQVGFHIICDGYCGFKVSQFLAHIEKLCSKNQAHGIIVVLDTLKKFVDLMSKRLQTRWGRVMRQFIAKGGSVIALAHVNKHPGDDGKPIYAGTTDIIDDADCAYVMDVINTDADDCTRTVEFDNKKRRGMVVERVAYSYSIADDLTYEELLASVHLVDQSQMGSVREAAETQSDTDMINFVMECIGEGIVMKMQLRDAVSTRSGASKRATIAVIDKYSGEDPDKHRWNFTVHEHGRKVYQVLEAATHGQQ